MPLSWNPDPANHESQILTRRVARDPRDEDAWARLRAFYAGQSTTWQAWTSEQIGYAEALRRGLCAVSERQPGTTSQASWLEFGAGTGESTTALPESPRVVHTDAVAELVREVPSHPNRAAVVADVRRLPFADGAFDLAFGLNAIPYFPELVRVTRSPRMILLAYSFGAATPVYLDPRALREAVGPQWKEESDESEWGSFTLLVD